MRYNADSGCYLGYEYEVTHMSLEQLLHEKTSGDRANCCPSWRRSLAGVLAQLPVPRRPLRVILISSSKQGELQAPGFLLALILDLEALLGRRVEIVIERALRPELRENGSHDARPL